MNPDQFETRNLMEEMILREVHRLADAADVTAFVRYPDATLKGGPLDFVLVIQNFRIVTRPSLFHSRFKDLAFGLYAADTAKLSTCDILSSKSTGPPFLTRTGR